MDNQDINNYQNLSKYEIINRIMEKSKNNSYIGENISQYEHMYIAGYLAYIDNQPKEIILASYLHDIGHQLSDNDQMYLNGEYLGIKDHEKIGADFLRKLNVNNIVCQLVENHVKSKRYKISTDPKYKEQLSDASIKTLTLQGGLMDENEIENFKNDKLFYSSLLVRHYDECSKVNIMNEISQSDNDNFLHIIKEYLDS